MTNKLTKRQLTALQEFGFSVLHDVVYVGDFGNEWDITDKLAKFADFLTKKDANPEFNLTKEDEGFIVECALDIGFEIINDDATEYKATDDDIVSFAKRLIGCEAARKYWQLKPKPELGWCLEKDFDGELHYAYVNGDTGFGWTTDNLKALRLSRKEDADSLAELLVVDRVAEHMWIGVIHG